VILMPVQEWTFNGATWATHMSRDTGPTTALTIYEGDIETTEDNQVNEGEIVMSNHEQQDQAEAAGTLSYTSADSFVVNAMDSVGVVTMTQTSGVTALVAELVVGFFVVVRTVAQVGDMHFDLAVDGVVAEEIIIPPLNFSQTLVLVGGDTGDPGNWQ